MSQSPIALNVIIRSLGSRPRQTAREQVTVNPTEWALIASSLRRVRHAGSACGLRLGGAALLAVLFTTACGDWLDHPVAAQTNGTVPAEIQTEAVTEAPESNSSDRANQVDPAAQPDLDEQPVLEQPDPDQPAAGEVSDLEAARLIAQLASPKFAERENAVVEIVEIGMPMVPHLRRAIAKADDPELKQRATTALVHLTSGHFEAKVADFLRFKNDGSSFEGWLTTSAVLGDTGAVREMFIQILRSHPQVVAALDGTTRDRNLALEQASQTIQINMFQHHIFPSLSDGVALLLPLCDPDVVFSVGYESTLISVLQKHIAQLRQDAGLNGPSPSCWMNGSRGAALSCATNRCGGRCNGISTPVQPLVFERSVSRPMSKRCRPLFRLLLDMAKNQTPSCWKSISAIRDLRSAICRRWWMDNHCNRFWAMLR